MTWVTFIAAEKNTHANTLNIFYLRRAGLHLSREAIKRNKKQIPPIASLDETNPALV